MWSTINLGQRVLYPAEYLACGAIVAGLDFGIPAWFISRFLPIIALCLASIGMFGLLLSVRQAIVRTEPDGTVSTSHVVAASATAVLYACSSFSFTQLAAGHWLYLISIASIPWAGWILVSWQRGFVAVLAGGLLFALAYTQIQFMLIAPASLLIVAMVIGSRRLGVRTILSAAVGVLPHLPWIVPLILYPASVNISAFLVPGTDSRFSIRPFDALRLVGYLTPFSEVAVQPWFALWSVLSAAVLVVAMVGLFRLPRLRAVGTAIAIVLVIYYQWGAGAPGYQLWSHLVPWPMQALLRERYALSFLTLVAISILFFAGAQPSQWIVRSGLRVRRRKSVVSLRLLATATVSCAILGAVGPFVDGHLGPFGSVREDFSTATFLTDYIESHGGGAVLTVPFGSIIRGPDWPTFGRSPFNLGGPAEVLDAEGPSNAPALPLVQALAHSLNEPVAAGNDISAEYARLLGVTYVVEWNQFSGDVPLNRDAVIEHLRHMGAEITWSNPDATLWRMPSTNSRRSAVESHGLLVVSRLHSGATQQADKWHVPLALAESGKVTDVIEAARRSGDLIHIDERSVSVTRDGARVKIGEPVFIAQPETLLEATLLHELTVTGSSDLAFADGTPLPRSAGSVVVGGPIDALYPAKVEAIVTNQRLLISVGGVQDTRNVHGLSLAQAGIAARIVRETSGQQLVSISASLDEAGLPLTLPVVDGAHYSIAFQSQSFDGSVGRVAVLANGATTLLYGRLLSRDAGWSNHTVHFTVPAGTKDLYMYFYLEGSNRSQPARLQLRGLLGTASKILAPNSVVEQSKVSLNRGLSVAQLPVTEADLAYVPDLAEAASAIQNSHNVDALTLPQAGIRAKVTTDNQLGPTVTVEARRDEAGLPIRLPLVENGTYELSMRTRHVSGPRARVSIVVNGVRTGFETTLPSDSEWKDVKLQFLLPADAKDVYAYLYVNGLALREVPSAQMIAGVAVKVAPSFRDVVLIDGCQADSTLCSSTRWVVSLHSADTWWHLAVEPAWRSHLLANGIGSVWLEPAGPPQPRLSYSPQILFMNLQRGVALLFLVAALAGLASTLLPQLTRSSRKFLQLVSRRPEH
jgi:hypothetical protein